MIPMIEQLHAKYKDNDKVAVLAVSLDHPDTPAKTIEDAGKQLKLTMPLLRDNGIEARERLKIIGPPTTLFIDAKGVLQDCIIGFSPVAAAAAPRKLERLLAGEDLAKQTLEEFQQQSKEIEKAVDMQFAGEVQTRHGAAGQAHARGGQERTGEAAPEIAMEVRRRSIRPETSWLPRNRAARRGSSSSTTSGR